MFILVQNVMLHSFASSFTITITMVEFLGLEDM